MEELEISLLFLYIIVSRFLMLLFSLLRGGSQWKGRQTGFRSEREREEEALWKLLQSVMVSGCSRGNP